MKIQLLAAWLSALALFANSAMADAVDQLREFVRTVNTGKAEFTQQVFSADGARKKTSSGQFEFSRPNRFRFHYLKPFDQLIVADGQKVWIFDADLNQASSRKMGDALGATPAALLAGGNLDKDFELSPLPSRDGIDWAQATPRQKEGGFQNLKVGFKGKQLAAIEIIDAFNQKSVLQFSRFEANVAVAPSNFQFKLPAGADVVEQ